MAEGELDHLPDLGHLLPASADVVGPLLVLSLDGIALAVDDGIGSHDAVGARIGLHDLELHRMHGGADQEEVPLLDGPVGLQEVGLEVNVEEVAADSLDGIVQGQDVDALPVRDVPACRDRHHVGEADPEVLADHLVHADVGIVAGVVGEDDADRVPALLALDEDGVPPEQLQLLHLGGAEADDRVVVVGGVVHDEAVGGALLDAGAQDGVLHVGVLAADGFGFGFGLGGELDLGGVRRGARERARDGGAKGAGRS